MPKIPYFFWKKAVSLRRLGALNPDLLLGTCSFI